MHPDNILDRKGGVFCFNELLNTVQHSNAVLSHDSLPGADSTDLVSFLVSHSDKLPEVRRNSFI